jgi:hypothetical protein
MYLCICVCVCLFVCLCVYIHIFMIMVDSGGLLHVLPATRSSMCICIREVHLCDPYKYIYTSKSPFIHKINCIHINASIQFYFYKRVDSIIFFSYKRVYSHTKHPRTLPCKHIAGQKVHLYTASNAQDDLAGNSPGPCKSSDVKDRQEAASQQHDGASLKTGAARASRSCVYVRACVCACMCLCMCVCAFFTGCVGHETLKTDNIAREMLLPT